MWQVIKKCDINRFIFRKQDSMYCSKLITLNRRLATISYLCFMDATQDKRLFLIDAYAMIFRGYYALIRSPRLTSKGMNTSAIFGFTNSLIELIKEKSQHILLLYLM